MTALLEALLPLVGSAADGDDQGEVESDGGDPDGGDPALREQILA
ncbi:hypothetical protein [Streptomyces sp. NBC_01429]|nr:hypothetical protein [Streptomyces sp. NBC_01429]